VVLNRAIRALYNLATADRLAPHEVDVNELRDKLALVKVKLIELLREAK
jgi:hypothetical protein